MTAFQGGVAITGTGFMGPAHLEALRRLGIHVVGILGFIAGEVTRSSRPTGA